MNSDTLKTVCKSVVPSYSTLPRLVGLYKLGRKRPDRSVCTSVGWIVDLVYFGLEGQYPYFTPTRMCQWKISQKAFTKFSMWNSNCDAM